MFNLIMSFVLLWFCESLERQQALLRLASKYSWSLTDIYLAHN